MGDGVKEQDVFTVSVVKSVIVGEAESRVDFSYSGSAPIEIDHIVYLIENTFNIYGDTYNE